MTSRHRRRRSLHRPVLGPLAVMLQDSAAAQGRRVNNKRLRVTRGPGESRDNNFSPREVEFSGLFPLSPSLFYRQQLHHNLLAKPPRDESFPQPQDRPPADAIAFPATSADDLPNPRVNKSCLPKNGDNEPKMAKRRGPTTRRTDLWGAGKPIRFKGCHGAR